jgi:N-acetylneuraminate synthase
MGIKVIAEIGNNHQGELDIARRLIDSAAEAGCWAVKSQKRSMREEWKSRPYDNPNSFGKTYWDHREALELTPDAHRSLKQYAEALGLEYFVSPWDAQSASEMDQVGMKRFKLASACLTDEVLLSVLTEAGKPVIMSTGMSTWEEIGFACDMLANELECIMLCTSTYPCEFEDIRLGRIELLSRYIDDDDVKLGFSGHHHGIAIDIAAAAMGCEYIERHLTLDRSWRGSDHAASLEPGGLDKLCRDLKAFEAANQLGPEIVDAELPIREKLRV